MFTAYVIVTVVTIAMNAGIAITDYARAKFVLANSVEVGVPVWSLPLLGTLKMAGALGLILGLVGVRFLGIAAAAGLVLFFVGAVATHIRARVFYNIAFPGGYLAMACASLALVIAQ